MAQPPTTHGSSVGFGEESTYGTAVARTNWLPLVSSSIKRSITYDPEPTMGRADDLGRLTRRKHVTEDNVEGETETVFAYDDSTLLLLKHGMGGLATTGTGPYTHTFTLGDLPTGLTAEWLQDPNDTDTAEVFEGMKISSFTIGLTAGGLASHKCSWIGETSGGLASGGAPTYSSNGEEARDHHLTAAGMLFNAVNYTCLTSFELSVDNGIDRRNVLGSKLTKEPAPANKRAVTIAVTQEWQNNNIHAAYLAGTESDAVLILSGTGNNQATITLQNAYVSEYSKDATGPGVYEETFTLTAQSDGTDLGLAIVVINDNSAATAN